MKLGSTDDCEMIKVVLQHLADATWREREGERMVVDFSHCHPVMPSYHFFFARCLCEVCIKSWMELL